MTIEVSTVISPRITSDSLNKRGFDDPNPHDIELENASPEFDDHGHTSSSDNDDDFRSMDALEILRETVRIMRYNVSGFMLIAVLLICPVSAVLLSNVLVDQYIVKRLTVRLLLVSKSSGLPLRPFIKQSWQRFAEMAVSEIMCFPLFVTLSLLSKAAVVYSVDCTYLRKKVDVSKFFVVVLKIWKRLLSTYLWVCMVIVGCVTLFLVSLIAMCDTFSVIGFPSDILVSMAIIVGLVFSVVIANCVIICNIAIVISVLEDVSGPQALLRSSILIRGQTQVGLLMFLGSTIGMAFVEGLFEHRVKTLSYGDGSSRIWEGPLLVTMYSFIVLIDSMMSAVFYFSCRSYNMEHLGEECQTTSESMPLSSTSIIIQ